MTQTFTSPIRVIDESAHVPPIEAENYPWDQLPDETNAEYKAFTEFLYATPRVIRRIAKKLGVSDRILHTYKAKHEWDNRALAFDRHMAELRREQVALLQNLIITEEIEDYNLMRAIWHSRMNVLGNNTMSFDDMSKMAASRDRIAFFGRRAAGLPTVFKDASSAEDAANPKGGSLDWDDTPAYIQGEATEVIHASDQN